MLLPTHRLFAKHLVPKVFCSWQWLSNYPGSKDSQAGTFERIQMPQGLDVHVHARDERMICSHEDHGV
jgi:hypothetical protein